MDTKITTAQAVAHLRHTFKTDPGYRESWKANIAMAFADAGAHILLPSGYMHAVANKAAEQFLQQFEKG